MGKQSATLENSCAHTVLLQARGSCCTASGGSTRHSLPLDTRSAADKMKGALIELGIFTAIHQTGRPPRFGTEHPVRDLRALWDKTRAPVEQGQPAPAGWAALSAAHIKADVRSLCFIKGNQRKLRAFDHSPGSDTRERSSAEASTRQHRPPCEAGNESTKQ